MANLFVKHFNLYRLVKDMHNDDSLREEFRKNPGSVLKKYMVPEEVAQAVVSKDYVRLYMMGISPLTLFNISHIVEKNPDKYRLEIVPQLPQSDEPPAEG
ncbi:MAG: hypothetical protein QXV27_00400 [Candidatus Caldarchaeum sp.]